MFTPTRKGSTNIPLPGHLGSGSGIPAPGDAGLRTSSAASNYSDTRAGRSSSLSQTRTATASHTRLPQLARPVFSLGDPQRTPSRADSLILGPIADKPRTGSTSSDSSEAQAAYGFIDEDDGERVLPVRVAVRIRPLLVGDQQRGGPRGLATSCVEASNSTIAVSGHVDGPSGAAGGPRSFSYDYAFGAEATQAAVYDAAILPLLQRFVEGYNVTVLAYGQTSSGKTYTMGTDADDIAMLAQPGAGADGTGIVPRALQWLFAWAQPADGDLAAPPALRPGLDIAISFLEVYNEDLIDLVARTQSRGVSPPIFVREDAKGNILWTGVKEVPVASAADALEILLSGSRERQTGGTKMNEKSSRSHAIYSISLTQTRLRKRSDASSGKHEAIKVHSKLHFVDLAGSERLKKTMAVGERQREGISINTGLLALGNVISALGDPKRGQYAHVPYRESKLTYMLRDSLGGSAQTLLIACVSGAEANAAETVNTLQYASRARNIKNRGGVNMVSMARATTKEVESLRAVVRKLKGEVRELTSRLQACEAPVRDSQLGGTPAQPRTISSPSTPSRIPSINTALQKRAQFAEELVSLKSRNMELETQLEAATDNYTELLLKFNDACRDIEEHQNESFERDQKLRSREQELRRLTAHSERVSLADLSRPVSVADTLRKRRSVLSTPSVADGDGDAPSLPDLARLNSLRTASIVSKDGPGPAEFDAILEEYDSSVHALEDELKATKESLEGLKLQLSMQESKSLFAEKLNESQQAQVETLRMQVAKAREAGEEEEHRRRAAEAELEDAHFNAETQLESVVNEWRLELQHVDEQWNERWAAAQDEHQHELEALRSEHQRELEALRSEHQHALAQLQAGHDVSERLEQQLADHEIELQQQRTEHELELQQQRADYDAELAQQQSNHDAELASALQARVELENELAQQRAEFEAELTRMIQQRSEYEAELTEQRAEYEQLKSEYHRRLEQQSDKPAQLMTPPPTAHDAQLEAEARTLRLRALDAEARAASAEEALAVLSAKAVTPESSALSPAEKRLRAMRGYRHSIVPQMIAEPVSPSSDKFASYPELQLASSAPSDKAAGAPANRPAPVFDADQVQAMLRDAAADAERQASFERERQALHGKIRELKEAKKELQGHNSQFKNLMRDLGEKLVGLAQENDALEAKASDRDVLAAEVDRLLRSVEELQTQLLDAQAPAKLPEHPPSTQSSASQTPSLRSASATLDSPGIAVMRTRLQNVESELASHLERACLAEEDRDRYCTELHRARAELRRMSAKVEQQQEEQDRRKHRFSRLLCLV